MNPRLVITSWDGEKRTFELTGERVTLGRSIANQLSFPEEKALSRRHAAFEREGERWIVEDLASRNGTFVNELPVAGKHPLSDGDRLRIARLRLIYEEPRPDREVSFESSGLPPIDSTQMTSLETIIARVEGPRAVEEARSAKGWKSVSSALLRVGRELAGRRPLSELFEIILDLATDAAGAERGVLLTLEDGRLRPQARRGDEFRISNTVRDKVIEEKLSLIVQDVRIDPAWESHQSIVAAGIRTLMAVPLQTEERVIGMLYLDSAGGKKRFTTEDLELITVMANVAAIRIEGERLAEVERAKEFLDKELAQAAAIQRQCLPEGPPRVAGLDIAGYSEPCLTVGGDYYGYFPRADGRLTVVVADVAGKGMPASLLMMNLQARVQVLSAELSDPAEIVGRLNDTLREICPANRFVTLFLAIIDPVGGEIAYSNAGHEPPLLVRASGRVDTLTEGGLIVGLFPDLAYEGGRARMETGDCLALFSDGLSEAMDPSKKEFGVDRIAALFQQRGDASAAEMLERVDENVAEWLAGRPAHDDLTVVVLIKTPGRE